MIKNFEKTKNSFKNYSFCIVANFKFSTTSNTGIVLWQKLFSNICLKYLDLETSEKTQWFNCKFFFQAK